MKINNSNPYVDIVLNNETINKESKFTDVLINEDKTNLLFCYIAASQAKKWFASKIIELDIGGKYHAVKESSKIPNDLYYKERNKYYQNIETMNKIVEDWKNANAEKFDITYSIPNVAVFVNQFNPTITCTLEEAIQGYKYANYILNNTDWTPLATQVKRKIKPEYADEYKKIKENAMKESGYPGDAEIKAKIPAIPTTNTRLCLNRKPFEDITSSVKFAEDYAKYVVENLNNGNFEEIQEKLNMYY